MVRAIQRQLVKRTLDLLTALANDKTTPEGEDQSGAAKSKYDIFYESFGKFLKLGLIEDKANRCAPGPALWPFSSSEAHV